MGIFEFALYVLIGVFTSGFTTWIFTYKFAFRKGYRIGYEIGFRAGEKSGPIYGRISEQEGKSILSEVESQMEERYGILTKEVIQ